MKSLILILAILTIIPGCANIEPFSPRARNRINAEEIEDIRTTQNSILREVGRIRTEFHGDENVAQSFAGHRVRANTGVQILSGDGALIVLLLVGIGLFVILFYRNRAVKSEKAAEIMAHQVALYDDQILQENIFLEAMNSQAEEIVYNLITKNRKN